MKKSKQTIDEMAIQKKKLKSTEGYVEIAVPRDRENEYEPLLIEKHQSDTSNIQDKVLADLAGW